MKTDGDGTGGDEDNFVALGTKADDDFDDGGENREEWLVRGFVYD